MIKPRPKDDATALGCAVIVAVALVAIGATMVLGNPGIALIIIGAFLLWLLGR